MNAKNATLRGIVVVAFRVDCVVTSMHNNSGNQTIFDTGSVLLAFFAVF